MFAPARRAWTSLSPPTRQFGVPFVVFLVTGTYGLSFLTAGRYELDDERRVRSQIGADPRKPVARTPRGGGAAGGGGGTAAAGPLPPPAAAAVDGASLPEAAAGTGAATTAAAAAAGAPAPATAAAADGAGVAADYTIVRIPRRGERPPPRAG